MTIPERLRLPGVDVHKIVIQSNAQYADTFCYFGDFRRRYAGNDKVCGLPFGVAGVRGGVDGFAVVLWTTVTAGDLHRLSEMIPYLLQKRR